MTVQRSYSVIGLLLSIALIMLPPIAYATELDWLSFSFKDLSGGKKVHLEQYRGTPVLITFFEPDCPWCFKQLKAIKAMRKDCKHVKQPLFQPVALGINGTASQLRHLITRAKPDFPALQATDRFVAAIGGVPATPITVLIGKDATLSGGWRGYQNKEDLKKAMSSLGVSTECKR